MRFGTWRPTCTVHGLNVIIHIKLVAQFVGELEQNAVIRVRVQLPFLHQFGYVERDQLVAASVEFDRLNVLLLRDCGAEKNNQVSERVAGQIGLCDLCVR